MAVAVQPVSVNGIEFDVLMTSSESYEATVPDYPIETGFTISDTVILSPETLDMTLLVSDRPVTWAGRFGNGDGRVATVVQQMKELYFQKELVTVSTSDMTYTDMAIISFIVTMTSELGYAREIPIKFKKVRTTTAETTTIPEEYGKSGATAPSAGTASTTVGYASAATPSYSSTASTPSYSSTPSTGGGSSSSASSNSSSNSSGKSSSILYGIASSAGLF